MNLLITRNIKTNISLVIGMCFVLSPAISGDSYAIKRYIISGGGGNSSGGNYQIRGTTGQTITGQSSGGSYSVQSGFWHAQEDLTDIIFKNGFE